jgi:hypothetical protein
MAIKVNNFNTALNGARIALNSNDNLYVNVVSKDMEGKFFMDSDKMYNDSTKYKHLNYVFFISIDWQKHTMSIGLCRKGESTHATHSWTVPINKDVMRSPWEFTRYLKLCVEHDDIMTTYLNG